MKIVGIQRRLNNGNIEEIMKFWDEFFTRGHFETLGLKGNGTIAVYSNYSTHNPETADFDLLIGGAVQDQEGYESIEIVDTEYKEYIAVGDMPEKIQNTWKKVWNDTGIERVYQTDYEHYTFSGNLKNPNVSIFIGIK